MKQDMKTMRWLASGAALASGGLVWHGSESWVLGAAALCGIYSITCVVEAAVSRLAYALAIDEKRVRERL